MEISSFDKLLRESLGVSARKEQQLAETSQRIQNKFNPLNIENIEHQDGDTFRLKDSDQYIRVTNDPSYSVDTFESRPEVYAEKPERLSQHRRNYAKLTGKPEFLVTIDDLVERGKVQSEQTRQRMAELGKQGRLALKPTGEVDVYGRPVNQLIDTGTGQSFFAGHSGREQNASYDSPYNAGQRLDDLFSGQRGKDEAFTGPRPWKDVPKDLGVSLAAGTGRMALGLAQGTITALGGNTPAADRFFSAADETIQNFSDSALSNEALARNARIDRNRARTAEAYDVRKQEYLKQGYTLGEAKLFAGAEEFQDTVGDLITEPGYVLDKTVESLPYMIGVGAAGRVAVNAATKSLSKRTLNEVTKAGGTEIQAAQSVDRYLKSEVGKKLLGRVATSTGVGTIGLTEGLTNSAEVYRSVSNMSEEEAQKSDQYRSLRQEGMSHQQATRALAKAAFEATFIPGITLAAAASLITGAAGFESRLFTRRAGESAVARITAKEGGSTAARGATEGAKGGLIRRGVVGTARNVGRFARYAGPAGASEALEEGIQSGGGEFLSQLAKFEVGTGPEPGAGIGAAAGEGALIGLASGVGARSVGGAGKAIANAEIRKTGFDQVKRRQETKNITDNTGTPGGSKVAAAESAAAGDPRAQLDKLQKLRAGNDEKALDQVTRQYNQIEALMNQVGEENLTEDDKKLRSAARAQYVSSLDRLAQRVLDREKDPKDYSTQERQIIQAAMEADAPAVQDLDESTGLGRVYNHTKTARETIERMQAESDKTLAARQEVDPGGNSARVAKEKLGAGLASNKKPGLMGHFNRISEAIAQGDTKAFEERGKAFGEFLRSQSNKLQRVGKLLEAHAADPSVTKMHGVEYKQGATEGYYNILQRELSEMVSVRNELVALYREWTGKTAAVVEAPVVPAPVVEPKSAEAAEATQPAEGTEAAKPAKAAQPVKTRKVGPQARSTANEERTESQPAQPANEQPRAESSASTQEGAKPAASTESEPVRNAAETVERGAPAQSESSERSDDQPAASDVRRLEERSVVELREIARNEGIRGYSKLRKADLVFAIQEQRQDNRQEAAVAGGPVVREPAPEEEQPASVAQRLREVAALDGDTKTALNDIVVAGSNQAYRGLAKRAAQVLGKRNPTIKVVPKAKGTPKGRYNAETGEIEIRRDVLDDPKLEQTVLHEAIHAALDGWVKANPDSPLRAELRRINTALVKELGKAEYQNSAYHQHMRSVLAADRTGEEIIAWGLTNPAAQDVLRAIESGSQNEWTRFVAWVAKALGLESRSGLSDLLEATGSIFDELSAEAVQAETVTEAEAVEQAQAQPERSSEAEAEGTTAKDVARNDVLWDMLRETQRLQRMLADGSITEDQVRYVSDVLNQRYQQRLMDNTAAGALAQIESSIMEVLNTSIPRTPVPTENLSLDQALNAAKELAKSGKTEAPGLTPQSAAEFDSEASWPRLQRWLLGNPTAEAIKSKVQQAFAAIGVPTSVQKGFNQASKTAKSLITAVPNLHEILANPVARRQLYDALNLKPEEEVAFEAFRAFRTEFAEAVGKAYQELVGAKIQFPDGNWIEDNPAYLLTDLSDTMDPAAITAMAYESMNWLSSDGQATLYNDDDAIVDILGLEENATPTLQQRLLRTAGTLRRNIVDSLGQAAWRHLNLNAKSGPEISPNLQERMEAALGTIMVRALIVTQPPNARTPGRIEAISFDGGLFERMKGENLEQQEDYTKPISFVRIMPYGQRGRDQFYQTDDNADLQEAVRGGRSMFQRVFGVSNVVKEPLLIPPTDDNIPARALRSVTKLSKKLKEAIRFQQAQAWTTDNEMIETLRRFDRTDYLTVAHEYNPDIRTVHELEQSSVEGRNRTLETAFENAMKWHEENGDRDFYLTYAMTRTGRTIVTSTFLNPQSSKLHRFIFRQKAWKEEVDPSNTRLLENFKLAVALGMDLKIGGKGVDKLPREVVLQAIDAHMDSKEVKDALASLATDGFISLSGENNALANQLKKNGTHTLAALLAWNTYQAAKGKPFTTSLPMEVDGVTNGFAAGLLQTPPADPRALSRIKDLLRATGVLFTDDTATSFPGWLREAGKQDNYQRAAAETANALRQMMPGGTLAPDPRSRDKDVQAAVVISENIETIINSGFGPTEQQLRDPKVGRDFAKNPLMIVAYGASSRTVARNLVSKILDKVYADLAATNELAQKVDESNQEFQLRKAEAILSVLNRAVDVMNVGQESFYASRGWSTEGRLKAHYTVDDLRQMIRRGTVVSQYGATRGEVATNLTDLARWFQFEGQYDVGNFTRAMEATYGRAIETALGRMLGGIREIRNTYTQAITLMSAIFKVEFERRVGIEQRATGRVVGRRRRTEILEQMHREGLVPSIATPYSETLEENLELAAYEQQTVENEKVKIHFPKNSDVTRRHYDSEGNLEILGDGSSLTTTLTTRTPSTDVGVAGVVGTIHSLDGTNSADVFGAYSVLNMFDAWVMKLSDMDNVPLTANDRFYNQHHDYDMGQELRKSFQRMTALLRPGDGRLGTKERAEIGIMFLEAVNEHGGLGAEIETVLGIDEASEDTDIDYDSLFVYFESQFSQTVDSVSQAKQELFALIANVNQFSHDESSYQTSAAERAQPTPTVEQTEKFAREEAAAQKITSKAETLARNRDADGNFNQAFFNWIQEEVPRPREALRTLFAMLQKVDAGMAEDAVGELTRVLHNYLDDTNPILIAKLPNGVKGQYFNGQIILDAAQFTGADNVIETLLHEIVHAATDSALSRMEEENPDLLKQLVANAREAQKRLSQKKNRTEAEQHVLEVLSAQKDPVLLVGEYLAYTLTQDSGDTGGYSLLFGRGSINEALRSVGRLLTNDNSTNLRLRSSQDKVNNKLFDKAEEHKLESEKLWDNFERMVELDEATEVAPSAGYREHILALMEQVLIPGLSSLGQDTYLQLGIETDGTKNLGEVERGSDKNVLRVQAAGAKLTNNGGMSNQEVFAHELTHAVTGYAIERSTRVRAELRKIFDSVKDRITWQDFMPAEEDIAGDRTAVEEAARARYNYIFGVNQDPEHDALQEFMAIGLTNEAFALALTRLEAPTAQQPIWDGNILSSMLNLITRALELFRSEVLGTRKALNANDALFKLAQKIVTLNKQAEVRGWDKGHDSLWRNSFDTKTVDLINRQMDRIQEATRAKDEATRQKGGFAGLLRAGTHAALASRAEGQQQIWNKFQRYLGVNKSSDLAQAISEVLPYNKDDRGGAEGKVGFLDLLRHSKVNIDISRQRAIESSRRLLLDSFDKDRPMSRGQRLALTNAILKTDLVSLQEHNPNRTLRDIQNMLRNPQLVQAEINRLERELANEMAERNVSGLNTMFARQIESLSHYMVHHKMTEVNGMKNAHNIVHQFNLARPADRVQIRNPDPVIAIVDQLATLKAVQKTEPADISKALEVIDHEMDRTGDNGFLYLMGMYTNFKKSSAADLFRNNPVLMRKGYVFEMTDGDVNVEVIVDTPEERKRMHDLGMVEIGVVQRDPRDQTTTSRRVLYKGFRGANTWQKATVSLTDTHRQGENLFAVSGYDPKVANQALGHMIGLANREALKQFKPGAVDPNETIAIPILDDQGTIVDYVYEMNAATKQTHLKNARNNDYFDQVLPRMFGSITDRVESSKINSQVAQLLYDEYKAFKNSDEHNFVFVGKDSTNPRAREMYALLPDGMKRELNFLFRGTEFKDGFPIRDEAVNLVLGFRKLSILDIPSGDGRKLIRGKTATFAARTAEKIWQELMQLVRIKMAIINPTVVVGNLSSNFGILLAEGIPVKYIQAKTSEAIRSMRQYQKDIRRIDELQRTIGVYRANGRPVQGMVNERERLKSEIRKNPVGTLVEEGLFTSIVEDVSSDEDTYREWVVGGLLDKAKGPLPGKAVQLAKEAYMVPGSNAFNMAIAATQYGDFIGRYVKFKYDTEVRKVEKRDALNRALASFVYYDMPQNRWLQFANDNGFMLFSKFFLRIQPVVARLFQENPLKATGILAAQQALMNPFDENIGTFALFQGIDHRINLMPFRHLQKLDPTEPSLFKWLLGPFGL